MKKITFLYHLISWIGIYLLWIAVFRSYSLVLTKTMTIEFCYLIFITADFYIINNIIVPQFLLKKRTLLFILTTLLTIAISAWLRTLVAIQMNLHFFHEQIFVKSHTLYINSVVNIAIWVLLISIAKMLIERTQTQRQLELLEKERVKTELDFLKAQINPHALFNSLNTVYGYINKNNQAARNVLLQFSELLRYQLYDCGAEKVSLQKELDYIKNYIEFHRLRKDEKLIVNFDVADIEPNLKIAPLLLVVLIENAFKFVSDFADKENKINISVHTKGNVLYCSFSNTKEMQQMTSNINSNGIGINNLKRRLALLYPNKYELIIKNENDIYETKLIIDSA